MYISLSKFQNAMKVSSNAVRNASQKISSAMEFWIVKMELTKTNAMVSNAFI